MPHSVDLSGNALSPSQSLHHTPPTVSHPPPRPHDRGMPHGYSGHTDARPPHHHRGYARRSRLLPPAGRREGVARYVLTFLLSLQLATTTPGDLAWEWVSDTSLALWARVAFPWHDTHQRALHPYAILPPWPATERRRRQAPAPPPVTVGRESLTALGNRPVWEPASRGWARSPLFLAAARRRPG